MSAGDGCCCLNICCGCTQDVQGNCLDSGPVPSTLHVTVSGGCGTFSGTITRQANNCWQGTMTIMCITRDLGCLPPNTCLSCLGPFVLCILVCCGTAFPTVPNSWSIFLTCDQGCANLGAQNNLAPGTYTNSCTPFQVQLSGCPSINNCINCTDDTWTITITA